eukprot:gene7291-biopygen22526
MRHKRDSIYNSHFRSATTKAIVEVLHLRESWCDLCVRGFPRVGWGTALKEVPPASSSMGVRGEGGIAPGKLALGRCILQGMEGCHPGLSSSFRQLNGAFEGLSGDEEVWSTPLITPARGSGDQMGGSVVRAPGHLSGAHISGDGSRVIALPTFLEVLPRGLLRPYLYPLNL